MPIEVGRLENVLRRSLTTVDISPIANFSLSRFLAVELSISDDHSRCHDRTERTREMKLGGVIEEFYPNFLAKSGCCGPSRSRDIEQ